MWVLSSRRGAYDCAMDVITSTANETVRRVGRLSRSKERRETGLVLIEGPNLFAAALEAGARFVTVVVTEDDWTSREAAITMGARTLVVTDRVLASISDAKHPRSPVAAIVRPTSLAGLTDVQNIVVMAGISDPGNAGTIIRTAAAFEWAVAATPKTVDLWGPKTLRSGAGAHFTTAIFEDVDIATASAGRTSVATVARGGEPGVDRPGPFCLLIGGEARGLDAEVVDACDRRFTIPTGDAVESLNAAVAAAIAMHTLSSKA